MRKRLVSRSGKSVRQASGELEQLRRWRPVSQAAPATFAQGLAALDDLQRRMNKSSRARLAAAWSMALEELFGERAREMQAHCEVRGSFGGSLRVSTDSPALAHELGRVRRQQLLDRMRALLAGKESLAGLEVKASSSERAASERERRGSVKGQIIQEST
ncbi:DUF721 domain-containing protein [bacterium]|nr:MAG: DUF721 domain-containing protein [bacterium]RIK65615.1 MAG: hypothetical protein DCC64_00415 [Planctomycetota bacterium]